MILNTFVKVVKETPKSVVVHEIGSIVTSADRPFAGMEKADPSKELEHKGSPKEWRLFKRTNSAGEVIYRGRTYPGATSVTNFTLDDGREHSFDHCD